MLAHIRNLVSEHPLGCGTPRTACSCTDEMQHKQEERQYWFSACLSILSGAAGAWIGSSHSMAVLADSVHAFSDGSADGWSAIILRKIRKTPDDTDKLRRGGTKIIATLLAFATVWIVWEACSRYLGNEYSVSPIWILLAGVITSTLDLTKIIVLLIAQSYRPNKMRSALIWHALFDLRRSEIVAVMGVLGTTAMLLISFDLAEIFLGLDFIASLILSWYMSVLVRLIWQDKHDHDINIAVEKWLIKKITGFDIPQHHH